MAIWYIVSLHNRYYKPAQQVLLGGCLLELVGASQDTLYSIFCVGYYIESAIKTTNKKRKIGLFIY